MELTIFKKFPALKWKLPNLSICKTPTPLLPMENLQKEINHENLWVKRDDLTGDIYGGNKIRKLDFLLAEAVRKKVRVIATSGAIGSHHVLATCLYAKKFGIDTAAIQYPVPNNSHLKRNQEMIDNLARWKINIKTPLSLPLAYRELRKNLTNEGFKPDDLFIIPPGGTNPLGCIGYVNASLEIEEQRKEMGIEPFDFVFLPFGTGGTASGLETGFRLAMSPTRVVAVTVTSPAIANRWTLEWLCESTRLLLSEKLGKLAWLMGKRRKGFEIQIESSYLGSGYAHYGIEEEKIIDMMFEKEGIEIDPVYSAKAMRAFIDKSRMPEFKKKKMLFLLTLGKVKF